MKSPAVEQKPPEFDEPEAPLELMFIDEYLQGKGIAHIKDLVNLPEKEAKLMMVEACRFASLKLAEIESRAGFKKEIHYEG